MKGGICSGQIKKDRYFLGGWVRPLVACAEGSNKVEYLGRKVILTWSRAPLRSQGHWAVRELGLLCLAQLPSKAFSLSLSLPWRLLRAWPGIPVPWIAARALRRGAGEKWPGGRY